MGSSTLSPALLLPLLQLGFQMLALHADPGPGASFFGDSFVEVPSVDVHSAVHLRLQFYTSQHNGLLFLAAGQADYLLVELRSGILQVRLQLGSEEIMANSPAGLQLNNLVIHSAELLVSDGQMTLIVDGLFNTSVEIPGPQQLLDIQYGLYIGGAGTLELPYLSRSSSPFRGCLHTVIFNGLDVLSLLASGDGSKIFHRVQEGCSTEFSAGPDDPFSFLGPHSYIIFPGWSAREEGTIEFVITTSITQAPLIYQSGLNNDFIYLEIFDGRLRGVVEKGNGTVILHNNFYISDDQQHYVKVYVDMYKFEILVDYYGSRTSNRGIHSHLDLQGSLFIGGVNEKALHRLREHRLAFISGDSSVNRSFIGCLEDLRINLEEKSLQDALVTKGITTVCGKQEQYWDYENVYEQDEATTTPVPDVWHEVLGPVVEPCHPDPSLPPIFSNLTRLLHVSSLIVAEGGTAFLEWRHTQPTIDLNSASIRQSQVLFSVTNDPRHGQLELDVPSSRSRRKFTLLDVVNRKVKYVHDGSESPMDQLMLEVTVTARRGVPDCLRQGQIYLLPVMINPINDAPQVIFPHGDLMVILEHTRKHLSMDIIQAHDDDTSCDNLKFQLLGSKRMEEGYVEYDFQPGVPIDEFSCRDLEAGNVVYVHHSGPSLQLIFQVSDGMVRSPVAALRVIAIEPDIQIHNNTGLFISQGATVLITTANLSVETNAVKQRVTIIYRLTDPLWYGEIQKQGSMGGEWKKVEAFHQQDIEHGHVQYFSTDPEHHLEDVMEKLRFEVQVGQKVLPNNTFLIRIKKATIKMRTMVPLLMKNKRHRNITTRELEATLEDPNATPLSFYYKIIQAPKKGNLELLGSRLTEGFGFTQETLQRRQLSYSATIRNAKETEDSFQFRVTAGDQYSPVYTYMISIRGDPDAPALTNVLLSVLEGGQAVISKDHLFVQSLSSMDYMYEVIEGPAHGKLIWRTSPNWPANEEVITEFTNEDILHRRLLYQHDDSETIEDDIPFVAIQQDEGSTDPEAEEVRGVFRVSIQPVNDHIPIQVVNKVFNVVRNGQRLLTTDDIAFVDEDSGFSDAQLVLVRKDILFGSIHSIEDRSHQVYRFTQEDLRKRKILFVHSGADRGWIQLQVSDGLHQTTAVLEVQASDPYIQIVNNTGLVIHQGSQGTIDSSVLNLETNMDIRNDEDIRFLITTPPRWGMVLRGGQPTGIFSQRDLMNGEIVYHHNGSRNSRDEFQFSVEANQVAVEDTLKVTVFLDSHPSPLTVVHHKRIYVFEGEPVEIKKDHLLVTHEEIPPHKIIYSVSSVPQSGFLAMMYHDSNSDEPPSLEHVHSFTQKDINEGKVLYLHSKREEQTDQFTVDIIASRVDALRGIVVNLDVLPITVPLEVHNVTVMGGGSTVLSTDILTIPRAYITVLSVEFVILEPPKYGTIQNIDRPEEGNLHFFSWNKVEQQLIQYTHDGSKTLADSFTILANASEVNRQSQPKTISVTIMPRNDKGPVVTINAGLQMREGTTAEITPDILRSEDEDSPPEDVVYSIMSPTNGKVVLKPSPSNGILQFTQAQINSGLVQFVHNGSLDGGFSFDLSDGKNVSPQHFFSVSAHQEPVISLVNKQDLTMCPGTLQPITSQNLKAMTNSKADASSLFYSIQQPPQLGRLVNSQLGSAMGDVKNFTQAEVNSGTIFYQHEMPQQPFWLTQDALHFRVSSPPIVTEPYILRVSISFEASCPQRSTQLWRNKGLMLLKAQHAKINTSVLDASNLLTKVPESKRASYDVVFLVTELPSHGHLSVADVPINKEHPYFLQSDLVMGGLNYAHYESGAIEDHFRFKAWLRPLAMESIHPPQEGGGVFISEAFNITVNANNENPPRLTKQRHVLQAHQGSLVVLSRDHLDVVDPDSSPEEIEYNILKRSASGFLANTHNKQVPISRFTQAEVNAGHLVFIANGSSSLGSLDLSISDGHNLPIFTSLEVEVLPVLTTGMSQIPLEIPQDRNIAYLSRDHLQGGSQPGKQDVLYTITRNPKFGQLRVNQKPARDFSQKQVDQGEVTFIFTDFTSPEDEFQFLSRSKAGNMSGAVNVTVKALVKMQQGILWPRGKTILLDTSVLDASELANKTKSVPVFKIHKAPQGSQFVKVSDDKDRQPTTTDTFTQDDLERGLIALEVPQAKDSGQHLQNNSFVFELAAAGVPPALELLKYSSEPFDSSKVYRATLLTATHFPDTSVWPTLQETSTSPATSATQPQGLPRPSHNASEHETPPTAWQGHEATTSPSPVEGGTFLSFIEANMFSVIIPICLIILLLALILPLLFYLHKRNKTGKHNVQGTAAKPKNGAVVDQETFRKTDPNQAIPLTTVNTLEAKGSGPVTKGAGAGGQQDPELLQYCRTSNPTLKNNQYWV
ncbi:PREDICTED: chondroitin sulfate proteoglycan 4 [Gavialis gangeticus]|uniref:chondroitin sulfate proteoglycan 4 n=1 Tax=Gavialis gangeticus TaxID=94835 RepID=UPI00092F642F|nr:PREDICTED: chondroitin sulfate proteoglycan 4 [Gavialis gangeticus]